MAILFYLSTSLSQTRFIVDETETEPSVAEPFPTSRSLPVTLEESRRRHPKSFHYPADSGKRSSNLEEDRTVFPKLANQGLMYHRSSFSTLSIYDIKRFMPVDNATLQREYSDMPLTTLSKRYMNKVADPSAIQEHNHDNNTNINANNIHINESYKNNSSDNNSNITSNNNGKTFINTDVDGMATDEETNNKNKTKHSRKPVNDKTFIISRSDPTTNPDTRDVIQQKAAAPVTSRPKLRKKSKSTLTPKTHRGKNSTKQNISFDQIDTHSVATTRIFNDNTYICEDNMALAPKATNIERNDDITLDTDDAYTLKLKDAQETLTPRRLKNNTNAKKKKSTSNENTPRQLKKAKILKRTSALLKTLETSPYLQGPIRKPSDLTAAALARIKKP